MRAYCAFEDRPDGLIGAKLLALSLERHCRDFKLYFGTTKEVPEFAAWCQRFAPHVELIRLPPFTHTTIKQVKPLALLHVLKLGITDVTWLDTDILVLRDLEPLLAPLDDDTVLVAQDMDYAFKSNPNLLNHYRRKSYRELEYCVTTAILRVTARHKVLLEKLVDCLEDPFFLEQQALPPFERLEGFGYEQKIFEMLLTSENEEKMPVFPVRFIVEGSGIVQEMGVTTYGVRARLSNGLGLTKPWLVHLAGIKSWNTKPQFRQYRSASVYSAFAETYRDQMGEPMDWPNSSGISSKIARALSVGQPHWVGLAHCFAGKTVRLLKTGKLSRTRTEARETVFDRST